MIKTKTNSAPYYNIGQLRVDFWNKLKIETSELTRCHKGSENEKTHKLKYKAVNKGLAKELNVFLHSLEKSVCKNLKMLILSQEYTSLVSFGS